MTESNMQKTHNPYTPTTEEVSIGWSWYKSGWIHSDEIQPQFDRWLDEVKADAYDKAIKALFIGPAELLEVKAQAWEEGVADRDRYDYPENPYRQEQKIILSNNDYDQLRKALDEE